jgi:hypothetical protein
MKNAWILRVAAVLVIAALGWWIVRHASWVEVEETTPPTGAAARPFYSLGKIAEAAGAKFEQHSALEPLPPGNATLFLDSIFWDIFPERDAALKAWVAQGGHLVLLRRRAENDAVLRWLPPTYVPRPLHRKPAAADEEANDRRDDDEGDDAPAPRPASAPARKPTRTNLLPRPGDTVEPICDTLHETADSQPAFEPGRAYQRCLRPALINACIDHRLIRSPRARPQWELANDRRSYAMRVPYGQGSVTTLADCLPVNNDALPQADHALIASAVLQLHPGATLWIVDDEAGEPLHRWLWHHARAPLLLALAAIALALWRGVPRFGPRESVAPVARRSMGEQIRGTGQFIAATDPQALHAATRLAFDDAARARIERYDELSDAERVAALATSAGAALVLDRAALLAALHPGPNATPAQWLTAIAIVEQARRTLAQAASL